MKKGGHIMERKQRVAEKRVKNSKRMVMGLLRRQRVVKVVKRGKGS